MLPKGYKTIIDWFEEVAADPEYENPLFQRYDDEDEEEEEQQEPGIDSAKQSSRIESKSVKEPGQEQQAQAPELPLTPIKEPHQIPGVDLNDVLKIEEEKSVECKCSPGS
jgi:hypothetical protein